MEPLMIIIPDPEAEPNLCILIEKKSCKQSDDGTVIIEGTENSRMYSVEGAINFCTLVNNKLKNK